MNNHYLTSLFTPRSVALFGASDRVDSVGGVVFKNLLSSGFNGKIYGINPKRETVQGEKAWGSLDDIEETVDLAVVATPATSAIVAVDGTTDEIGRVAAFLLSPDAAYVTGQILTVDGGVSATF